jgi:hypothetical protein
MIIETLIGHCYRCQEPGAGPGGLCDACIEVIEALPVSRERRASMGRAFVSDVVEVGQVTGREQVQGQLF